MHLGVEVTASSTNKQHHLSWNKVTSWIGGTDEGEVPGKDAKVDTARAEMGDLATCALGK